MDIAILIVASLSLLADLFITVLLAAFFACWWLRKPETDPGLGQKIAADFVKALPMRAVPRANPTSNPQPE
jgi:hypothetical protein